MLRCSSLPACPRVAKLELTRVHLLTHSSLLPDVTKMAKQLSNARGAQSTAKGLLFPAEDEAPDPVHTGKKVSFSQGVRQAVRRSTGGGGRGF